MLKLGDLSKPTDLPKFSKDTKFIDLESIKMWKSESNVHLEEWFSTSGLS